ncbi:MAG: type III-B CRISPR module-associated Cmr3 family protein [Planctomycetota bacterium]|nr:type III-B CRISPR module-associated Cmr3 family protein [Planctomycetota bacterium]
MAKIRIFIQPSGPLFFRGGKPMDDNGRTRSDLPNPQVLAGAVTTLLLKNAGCDLKKLGEFSKARKDEQNLFEEALNEVLPKYVDIARVRFQGPWVSTLSPKPKKERERS